MTFVKQRCFCHCHGKLGDAAEMRHWGRTASAYQLEQEELSGPTGVSVHDHVACVMACDGCRKFHAAVLTSPPKDEVWDDMNPPKPATGCADDDGN
jgi:hypothetical protein